MCFFFISEGFFGLWWWLSLCVWWLVFCVLVGCFFICGGCVCFFGVCLFLLVFCVCLFFWWFIVVVLLCCLGGLVVWLVGFVGVMLSVCGVVYHGAGLTGLGWFLFVGHAPLSWVV